MKMLGKGKKVVTVAYKEKLLAQIVHYEKRIQEALTKATKRKNIYFENYCSDERNPYTLKNHESRLDLMQREESLSDRASKTLELALLTIVQSEVNVMVTPPAVRIPVLEDGIWQEVAAECKIDLVPFTITFYAHKPHRRFAPTSYRNVVVTPVKSAHQKELSRSLLPRQNRPNLAVQVLQSYATAFRSRRTTLLELAETYADNLNMDAMPEGGYRVRFLNVLQVEWTLENMWSPIVPFCHRMKFEVEYMSKEYIHRIGKLYKQFKDPSLETSERTLILSRIFDTCLEAQGLSREIQDSFESDPETASRLHERRTTIDQEPDVPDVQHSPEKPKGKENKAHNRKTNMAPPKTIPKKAKKAIQANERKRAIDDDACNDAKKSRVDDNNGQNKSNAGLRGGSNAVEGKDGDIEAGSSKTNVHKKVTGKEASAVNEAEGNNEKKTSDKVVKTAKEVGKTAAGNDTKKKVVKSVKSKSTSENSEGSGDAKSSNKKRDAGKMIDVNKNTDGSETSSTKRSKKDDEKNNDKVNTKESESDSSSKKNIHKESDEGSIASAEQRTKKIVTVLKDMNTVNDVAITKNRNVQNAAISGDLKGDGTQTNSTNTIKVNTHAKVRKVTSNTVAALNDDSKTKTASKDLQNKDVCIAKNTIKNTKKEANLAKARGVTEKPGHETARKSSKEGNTAKPKEVDKNIVHKKSNNDKNLENNSSKDTKQKETSNNAEKNKDVGRHKPTSSDMKTKNTVTTEADKNNITKNTHKKSEQDNNKAIVAKASKEAQKTNKNDELSKKTITKPDSVSSKTNKDQQPKKALRAESKTILKSSNTRNILTEKTNETQKVSKIADKNKPKTNDKKNTNETASQLKKDALLKSQQNADKMKTKIPIMKNKTTFSSLRQKVLVSNMGSISKVEKTRVVQRLPVFKNVVKNVATRMSPRKLPSTFKPSFRAMDTLR